MILHIVSSYAVVIVLNINILIEIVISGSQVTNIHPFHLYFIYINDYTTL